MTLKQLIKKNKFDYVNFDIAKKNFPDDGQRGKVELLDFGKSISTENALKEMDEKGYRPANLYELLEMEWNGKDLVVALGSVWQCRDGDRCVPCIARRVSGRYLYLHWLGRGWSEIYRFAAVRKELSPKPLDTSDSALDSLDSRVLELEKKMEKIQKFLVI